jgi:hypothetical protein
MDAVLLLYGTVTGNQRQQQCPDPLVLEHTFDMDWRLLLESQANLSEQE